MRDVIDLRSDTQTTTPAPAPRAAVAAAEVGDVTREITAGC